MSRNKKTKFISINNLSFHLGLMNGDVQEWIKRDKPKIVQNHIGHEAVELKLLEEYSHSSGYMEALHKALVLENRAMEFDIPEMMVRHKEEKFGILESCRSYINDLENIHRKYRDLINSFGYESKFMAAYLLFSRIISTAKICCLCQEHDHWYWASLLREIDEGSNLAEYFIIAGDSLEGKKHLHEWFRQNKAPTDSVCRKILSEKLSTTNPDCSEENNLDLMDELYHHKSKFTHQTFWTIREITKFKITDGMAMIEKIEYGPIEYQRKLLELSIFFRSNLIPCFASFIKCFQKLLLSQEDLVSLCEISKKIMNEDEQAYLREHFIVSV